jgi:hypothetical protein
VSRRLDDWRAAINLGYLARPQATLLNLTIDDEVFARAGVGYDLPASRPVTIDLTLSAATRATDFGSRNSSNLESLLGATVQLDPQLQLFGGLGAGLAHGFGTPDARVMVGVRLMRGGSHRPRKLPVLDRDLDSDHDGVPDVSDRCPYEAGVPELAGCSDSDDDGDGVPYDLDRCPSAPEDVDGFEDSDGCPDPDNDGDGILDGADQCPMEAGPEANHGCPTRPPEPLPAHPPAEPAERPPVELPPAEPPTDLDTWQSS